MKKSKEFLNNKKYKSHIKIFTDGSFSKKNKCVFAGYGVYFYNVDIDDISRKFTHDPITNQRTELYAIYKGLKEVLRNYKFDKLTIFTDSMYSKNSITVWINTWKDNNWKTATKKPVKNKDLILKIDKYLSMKKYKQKIFIEHVRSHTNKTDYKSKGNERADMLANKGALK
jgi:ribonuclease HI